MISARYKCVISTGLCLFGNDSMNCPLVETLDAVTGWNLTANDLAKIDTCVNITLHMFNLGEGWKPSDYTLPPKATGKPPLPEGTLKNDLETGAVPEAQNQRVRIARV